ncbi:MAG: acetyl-CoA carboxylase biotin carboxyl carrier protein subunit [Prevotella sp.]|nr:acetyl-CoA carboxylase biotin carboxyl carrier protein subunit [Prevotella sp.]MDE6688342.1 acetyl-CoA carboxylase biotin carboxyl carrier protein subunit [Prevotella sp.]MDE6807651.1 acetyl-CoA carboxylase biotin carboxyl carrier protein subunit [Prevotella sp.]
MKEYKYTINGTKYEVAVGNIEDNIVTVTVNGEEYKVEMEKQPEPEKKKPVVRPVAAAPKETNSSKSASHNQSNALKSPLPGVITDIKVAVGDEVQEDQAVVVLEAMKMANNLTAEKAGKVTAICVQVGESVMEGDALVIIE